MLLHPSALASLRYFEVTARLLSFKQAAAELHVTPGAVSQQIKHLEGDLGCKLFHRQPRQINLTDEGRRFAAVVAQALGEIEREARVLALTQVDVGIRLRAAPSFATRWLVPRLPQFYARHPDIKLLIMAAYGYFDPARREFDLAIETMSGKIPGLHSEVLMEEYLVPVCSAVYLKKHAFLKEPKDLARCTLLHDGHAWMSAEPDAEWRYWLREAGAPGVDSTQGQTFSLANMAIEAALTHQGVAMGRVALIKELLNAAYLVTPFERRIKSPMKYYLVYPKELAGRAGVKAVIRWLQDAAARSSLSR